MKTKFLLLVAAGCLLLTTSCDNMTTSFGLTIGSSGFETLNEDGISEPVADAVYKSGDEVYILLYDVSGFKKDDNKMNQIEMDMKITSADGKVIVEEKGLLGENGIGDLKNNIAPSLYAYYTPDEDFKAGEYTFFVKVIDKVGGGTASVSKKFTYR